MNKDFFKELLKGLKWVVLALIALVIAVASWYGAAWSLGWYVDKFFDLENFGQQNYVQLGSCVLVFTLIIQIVTVILTGWLLLSWGRSRGLGQKEKE
jgi:energy-coupling factor transporter transmembrane protein EcfT